MTLFRGNPAIPGSSCITVADDTDIFVRLLHVCFQGDILPSTSVQMVSPINDGKVIDINATVNHHRKIIPNLLVAHGLTGCDTVCMYFGVGRTVALNVLKSGIHTLSYIGDINHSMAVFITQATPFTLACYGQTKCTSLTKASQKM